MLLIKKIKIIQPDSKWHNSVQDIAIDKGKIIQISENITTEKNTQVIELENACISPGWFDLGVQCNEPGLEHKSDIENTALCAAKGGFTGIAVFPNSVPVVQNKSNVNYILSKSDVYPVEFYPLGSISNDAEGKDLTELYDMHNSGAIAFTDGSKSVQNAGLLLRALQYVKAFDGLILNHPYDKSIVSKGHIHEGQMSTSLGLVGIPSMSEVIMLQRDIQLLEYADSKLHALHISAAESVELIHKAKQNGLKITASVPVLNLVKNDEELIEFDSNLKVNPPLRSELDRKSLISALKNGTIDCLSSNHSPQDIESKNLEFPYADFGATTLEHVFSILNTYLKNDITLAELIEILYLRPRKVLQLPIPSIEIGEKAELTIFSPETRYTINEKNMLSYSKNSPYLGTELTGIVNGIINGEKQQWF